jgi:hypothetical protein
MNNLTMRAPGIPTRIADTRSSACLRIGRTLSGIDRHARGTSNFPDEKQLINLYINSRRANKNMAKTQFKSNPGACLTLWSTPSPTQGYLPPGAYLHASDAIESSAYISLTDDKVVHEPRRFPHHP